MGEPKLEDLHLQMTEALKRLERVEGLLKSHQPTTESELLTMRQAADYIGMKYTYMCVLKKSGKVSYIKQGNKVFFKASDLDLYIERSRRTNGRR